VQLAFGQTGCEGTRSSCVIWHNQVACQERIVDAVAERQGACPLTASARHRNSLAGEGKAGNAVLEYATQKMLVRLSLWIRWKRYRLNSRVPSAERRQHHHVKHQTVFFSSVTTSTDGRSPHPSRSRRLLHRNAPLRHYPHPQKIC
jgi:hypothetical protein